MNCKIDALKKVSDGQVDRYGQVCMEKWCLQMTWRLIYWVQKSGLEENREMVCQSAVNQLSVSCQSAVNHTSSSSLFLFFSLRQVQHLRDVEGAKCQKHHHHRTRRPALLGTGLHVVSSLFFFSINIIISQNLFLQEHKPTLTLAKTVPLQTNS